MLSLRKVLFVAILGLGLSGCLATRIPVSSPVAAAPAVAGHARVSLDLRVLAARTTQAAMLPYTGASINRLEVVPFEIVNGSARQMDAATGNLTSSATYSTWYMAIQASPSIALDAPIVFDNLKANTSYHIVARAYLANGTKISNDASSSLDITVLNDERPAVGSLPLQLIDRIFLANTYVKMSATGRTANYDRVTTGVYAVSGGLELPMSAATSSDRVHPDTVLLSYLLPYSTYRFRASAIDAGGSPVATSSVDVVVTNDPVLPVATISLTIPYVATTLAGTFGVTGSADGTGAAASFNNPTGVAVDSSGVVYVADHTNCTIRKITPGGVVSTFAGSAGLAGSTNGATSSARFKYPTGIAVDTSGNLFATDTTNNTIRKITPSGVVTTFAGSPGVSGTTDGASSSARFGYSAGILAAPGGVVYVADTTNHTIRKLTATGVTTTWAGSGGVSGTTDGASASARFNMPYGLALDAAGNLYVGDRDNHTIRKITAAGQVSTYAGIAGVSGLVNGPRASAKFNSPSGLAMDASGSLYVADYENHLIRKIDAAGMVTTFAGTLPVSGAVDGAAPAAQFYYPTSLALDAAGNLYVSDQFNHSIRKLK